MELPSPVLGLVIRYAYLWSHEEAAGHTEGYKDRPVAVILVVVRGPETIVLVVPLTHTAPTSDTDAIEVPSETQRRLGLGSERSWIVTTEANVFVWPGPDVRAASPSDPENPVFGHLPPDLSREVRDRVLANREARQIKVVRRE